MQRMSREREDAIVARLQQGMRGVGEPCSRSLADDLDRLFACYQEMLYVTCLRFVGEKERAMELAQEAQLVAWRKLPDFQPNARFSTWLYGIARHLCFNAIRRRNDLLTEDGIVEADSMDASALRQLERGERTRLVELAAEAVLDSVEQEAVYLRYVERLSQDRITQAMFEAEGCAATIAAGSMLTGLLVGLTPEEALALSRDAVEEALGGLPPTRRHAAALAIDATRAAVRDYRSGVLC